MGNGTPPTGGMSGNEHFLEQRGNDPAAAAGFRGNNELALHVADPAHARIRETLERRFGERERMYEVG